MVDDGKLHRIGGICGMVDDGKLHRVGGYVTWLTMVAMLVSPVVTIQFAFKLGKNPLAAKRE